MSRVVLELLFPIGGIPLLFRSGGLCGGAWHECHGIFVQYDMNVAALELPCGGPFRAMELAIDIQNYVKFFLVWFLLYTNNMPMLQNYVK